MTLADGQTLHPARAAAGPGRAPAAPGWCCTQGVYHQIKRMFGVYGAGVDGLHRTAIGGVALDDGPGPGAWRQLTELERSRRWFSQVLKNAEKLPPFVKKCTHFAAKRNKYDRILPAASKLHNKGMFFLCKYVAKVRFHCVK